MLKKDIALVFCLHANPSLGQSSIISTLLQDLSDLTYDFHFIYQVDPAREYDIPNQSMMNRQLSPFDNRIYDITDLSGFNIFKWHFQNDHALDSGAWWKWILNKDDVWKSYKFVWFIGEGAIFTETTSIRDTIKFATKNNAHFIAPGHEKRRLNSKFFLNSYERQKNGDQSEADVFHNKMIRDVFKIFRRNKNFNNLISDWSIKDNSNEEIIMKHKRGNKIQFTEEPNAEWYGCSTCNFMSTKFIKKIREKNDCFKFEDALVLPYAGTALEVIWGFLPQMLNYNKYFSDAIFRPRKNKPYNPGRMRVDTPVGYFRFLTEYYKNNIVIKPYEDMIKIVKTKSKADILRNFLPDIYFLRKSELNFLDRMGLTTKSIYSYEDFLFLTGKIDFMLRKYLKKILRK